MKLELRGRHSRVHVTFSGLFHLIYTFMQSFLLSTESETYFSSTC